MYRLSNLEPFFPEDSALGERAEFGMALGEVRTGHHGGQGKIAKALAA
jgi:hypothetical protein